MVSCRCLPVREPDRQVLSRSWWSLKEYHRRMLTLVILPSCSLTRRASLHSAGSRRSSLGGYDNCLFSAQHPRHSSQLRRPISRLWNLSSIIEYSPFSGIDFILRPFGMDFNPSHRSGALKDCRAVSLTSPCICDLGCYFNASGYVVRMQPTMNRLRNRAQVPPCVKQGSVFLLSANSLRVHARSGGSLSASVVPPGIREPDRFLGAHGD